MRDPRQLRRRAGTDGATSQDQYFLEDERVLDRILDYAHDASLDLTHVLEIGPGTGALTARLLTVSEHVTAIERDSDLASFLTEEFNQSIAADRLTVEHGDALEVPYPSFSACISNLPYGVSSELLFRLLPYRRPLIVMVQSEFGERMAADPDTAAYGRLSVTTQHYGAVEILETVPPSAFTPSPPVESALVRVLPGEPVYTLDDEELFFAVVRAVFTQRRKTLKNALANTTHISGIEAIDRVLERIDDQTLAKRPGALSPEAFAHITNVAAGEDSRE